MVTADLHTPYAVMSRRLPDLDTALRWGYSAILRTVPDCDRWKDCTFTVDGESQPVTLREVTRYRYVGYGYHGGGRPSAGRGNAINVRISDRAMEILKGKDNRSQYIDALILADGGKK